MIQIIKLLNVKLKVKRIVLICILFAGAGSYAQRKQLSFSQVDARFTMTVYRSWGVGSEEYWFYFQNNTSEEYTFEVDVTLKLACVGEKSFKLGINKIVHLMPNGKFDAFNDDWSHIITSGADNFKNCRLQDGDSYTLYQGMSYQISNIKNITVIKAEEQKKKEAKQKAQEEIKAGDQKLSAGDFDGAIKSYQTAKSLDPENKYVDNKIELANLKRQADIDKKKKLEEKKNKTNELIQKGDNSASNGKFKEAEGFYKEALIIDPSNASAKEKLEVARTNQKKADEKAAAEAKKKEGEKTSKTPENKGNSESKNSSGSSDKSKEENKNGGERQNKRGPEKSAAQIKAEQEEAKRKEEEERREAERKRKEQEEKERLARQKEYYQKQNAQRDANTKQAGEMTAAAILVHYYIGKLIYQDLDKDRYESSFKDDGYLLRFKAGYGLSSVPSFFNSSIKSYDGNNTSYKNEAIDKNPTTIDLQGGLEFWPLYGKNNGLGLFGLIGAGHGFTFENFIVFGNGGMQAYAGTEHVKLFTEYSFGFRNINMSEWIDPAQYGDGENKHTYHRIKLGPRFTFDADFMGATKANLDIVPVFDLPNYRKMKYFAPINIRWLNGLAMNLSFDNRLSFNFEYFWRYHRGGKVEYGYGPSATLYGNLIKLSVVRNFDFFSDSPLNLNPGSVEGFKNRTAFKGIMFLNGSFGWNNGKDTYVTKPNLGTKIAYEHDIRLLKNTNLSTGVGFSLNNGGRSTTNTSDTMKTSYSSIFVPLSIRSYVSNLTAQKYWVNYGINNHIAVTKNASGSGFSSSNMKGFVPSVLIGLGLDYKMGENSAFRSGISYERSLIPYYESTKFSIRSNQLTLHFGCIF